MVPPPELPVHPKRGIDLGPAGEVIEGTQAVPDPIAGQLPADQEGTNPGHRMLGRAPDHGLALHIEPLIPLALTDRVVT